jgi:CO/xanthine dehydrogenase FAD-binding subunit
MNVLEYIKVAGGTDLLIEWRRPPATTGITVIDISSIAELKGIIAENGSIRLKPLTTHSETLRSSIIGEWAPLLSSAASTIGSPQIRNRGTVGGNIMNAAACADTVPPLIALEAEVVMSSVSGTRQVKLADFFLKPYLTKATTEEVLTEIRFAKLPTGAKSCFIKLGRRNALSISRLSVAAVVVRDASGIITGARIVPGATFPIWRRVNEAETILIGEQPSLELFHAAGNVVSEMMIAETGRRWSTEFKEPVIAVLVRRALEVCCA